MESTSAGCLPSGADDHVVKAGTGLPWGESKIKRSGEDSQRMRVRKRRTPVAKVAQISHENHTFVKRIYQNTIYKAR